MNILTLLILSELFLLVFMSAAPHTLSLFLCCLWKLTISPLTAVWHDMDLLYFSTHATYQHQRVTWDTHVKATCAWLVVKKTEKTEYCTCSESREDLLGCKGRVSLSETADWLIRCWGLMKLVEVKVRGASQIYCFQYNKLLQRTMESCIKMLLAAKKKR